MQYSLIWSWLTAKLAMGEHDERGANLVEYILLVTFIAVAVIGLVVVLGGTIGDLFSDADDELNQ